MKLRPRIPLLPLVLVLALLWPVWRYRYLPTQDGPAHLANARILHALLTRADSPFHKFFRIDPTPFPNWAGHVGMALALCCLPPLLVEKLFVSGYILFFAFSLLYFHDAVRPSSDRHCMLLGFPFICSHAFYMGFYNYMLSIPLALFIVGFAWRHAPQACTRHAVILAVLCLVLYFCHAVSLCIALLVLGLIALLRLPRRAAQLFGFALALAPCSALFLWYWLLAPHGQQESVRWEYFRLWRYLSVLGVLHGYSEWHVTAGRWLFRLFVFLLCATFLQRFLRVRRGTERAFQPPDVFLVATLAALGLYFFAPDQPSSVGRWLTLRLSHWPFLLILPWLSTDYRRPAARLLAVAAAGFTLVYAVGNIKAYGPLNALIREELGDLSVIEADRTVLPMVCREGNLSMFAPHISPLRHIGSYYTIERNAVMLDDYEAHTGYFPIVFKPAMDPVVFMPLYRRHDDAVQFLDYPWPIDYIAVRGRGMRPHIELALHERYERVFANEHVQLFRRHRTGPAPQPVFWGPGQIRERQAHELDRLLQRERIETLYLDAPRPALDAVLGSSPVRTVLGHNPPAPRAEQAARIGVLNFAGEPPAFLRACGGSSRLEQVGGYYYTVHCGFTPPAGALREIPPSDWAASVCDPSGNHPGRLLTDANVASFRRGIKHANQADSLELGFAEPTTVCAMRLLAPSPRDYPRACRIEARLTSDSAWRELLPRTATTAFYWSGPRPYHDGAWRRFEPRFTPVRVCALRFTPLGPGRHVRWALAELQIFGPAGPHDSARDSLEQLTEFLGRHPIDRLYCDRWIGNMLRMRLPHMQIPADPGVVDPHNGRPDTAVQIAAGTGVLVRHEDVRLCRQALAARDLVAEKSAVGPWTLFLFRTPRAIPVGTSPGGIAWLGFACLLNEPSHDTEKPAP